MYKSKSKIKSANDENVFNSSDAIKTKNFEKNNNIIK